MLKAVKSVLSLTSSMTLTAVSVTTSCIIQKLAIIHSIAIKVGFHFTNKQTCLGPRRFSLVEAATQ